MDRRAFIKHAGVGLSAIAANGLGFALTPARAATGTVLQKFATPAKIRDLKGADQRLLADLWQTNLEAFTRQAIRGNPWSKVGMSEQAYYYDPASTPMPEGTQLNLVSWNAFPNRLNQYFGTPTALPPNPHNMAQGPWELADHGVYRDAAGQRQSFPEIPKTVCPQADWSGDLRAFGPCGPRGWQDEYCEWSVTKNDQGKITRVDFVCENPEYWHALWAVSPERVVQLYEEILNFGLPRRSPQAVKVRREDLELPDPKTGKPVIDPSTGAPAYNPQNKWNLGTVSIRGKANAMGGVVHLTCTANTLQAEVVSAAAVSTVLRQIGNVDAQKLGCCSQNTQPYRNSDFHIGQVINQVVEPGPKGTRLTVADPVRLYIQKPDFSGYTTRLRKFASNQLQSLPSAISDHAVKLRDPISGKVFPGNFILHAVFQIPASWIEAGVSFTVGDITIKHNGVATPIQYGAQITETFQIGIFAWAMPAAAPEPPQACVVDLKPPQVEPIQLMYEEIWDAYYGTPVDNPSRVPMTLASNSIIVPARTRRGATGLSMALLCDTVTLGPNGELPTVTVPGSDIVVKVTGARDVTYAPGHTYTAPYKLLTLEVDVAKDARLGLRDTVVSNFNLKPGLPAPGFLAVMPSRGA
jgi:hypothetical protein